MLQDDMGSWSVEKMSMYFKGLSAMGMDVSTMPPQATHILQSNGLNYLFKECYILADQSVCSWRDYMRGEYQGSGEHLKGVLYWFITGTKSVERGDQFAFVVETYDDNGLPHYMGYIRSIDDTGEFKSFSVEAELFDLVRGNEEIH